MFARTVEPHRAYRWALAFWRWQLQRWQAVALVS